MTKRDQFAMCVMNSLVMQFQRLPVETRDMSFLAQMSYRLADFMVEASSGPAHLTPSEDA